MPVTRKTYSVTRQMIMVIFPILDLWASYRIQKLRLYLLIFLLGFGILWTVTDYAIYGDEFFDEDVPFLADTSSIIIFILEDAITIIVAMIVIRKWTMEWNKKMEYEEK